MNAPIHISAETLPTLIDRATSALDSARSSAEVLEARDFARVAYDAAKTAGRMAKAKQAHEEIIGAVYKAQADALLIEARAKSRLADEYDAAQERGEVHKHGGDKSNAAEHNVATAADLGLRRDEIHEARQIRDAEKASPGLAERALNQMLEAGQEPTKAALRKSVIAAVEDAAVRPKKEKNPLHRKDAMTDRVFKFSGLCRSLAEFADVEEIAAWDRIPQTANRLPVEVREAMHILSLFMEAQDA